MNQAESYNSTSPSRRIFLRGIAAIPTVSAIGLPDFLADADLLMLGNQLDEAREVEKAAYAKWEGVDTPEADREISEAFEGVKAVVAQIERIPATTSHGIKVKMRAIGWCRGDEPFEGDPIYSRSTDVRLALSIYNDLLAMGA
ncbi:hypothetical protein A33M_3319 [Rhodovulum sp. PH10]|uniref:hypothetical protein n=1 Tax=Rhodovulum sp. PH10 TaxID=1187851 RepID=UPI00027C27F4|nr:hypothetical protein [Rhodovulum sp. PH10]EJW11241.1 hypothetical protein A33M_3319 [Rhodovulum sp. PH10]